jgi:hypothetical protein
MGYDAVIRSYLEELSKLPPGPLEGLGASKVGERHQVRMFGEVVTVGPEGVSWRGEGSAPSPVAIVVLKYLLFRANRDHGHQMEWVTFKDLKDSSPFVGAFKKNVEERIEEVFGGSCGLLIKSSESLGGKRLFMSGYEIAYEFEALGHIRIRLYFNDGDELFKPKAVLLFQETILKYLDIECIAALGWIFADMLIEKAGYNSSFLV